MVAPALLCNAFLKKYPSTQKTIVNISSGAANYPVDGWSTYCSSKAGLQMLSEVLALEAEKRNDTSLKVYSVAPGVVDTEMQQHIRQSSEHNFSRVEHFKNLKKDNQLTSSQDVAKKLAELLQNQAKFREVKQDVRNW
jgi:benzil reductase ((S)-benzoin forming)